MRRRPRRFHRRQRADLAGQRAIAADDARLARSGARDVGQRLLQAVAFCLGRAMPTNACAPLARHRGGARPCRHGRGRCDGTTMAVCRKSSDATNVRWEPCAPDQGPDRDSPLGYLIASGIFVATYRAVPVAAYLGVRARLLKGVGQRFEPFGETARPFDQFRRPGPSGISNSLPVDDLVGQQQRGEQQLARFATACRARPAPRGSWRRPAHRPLRSVSSSPLRQATL